MSRQERPSVSQLIEWGDAQKFGNEPIKLDKCSTIIDQAKFYNSHKTMLINGKERKVREKILILYYSRLLTFYRLLVERESSK